MERKYHHYWTNYSASKAGSVFGSRGKKLSEIVHNSGYIVMTAHRKGEVKQLRVHRLIWECFNGEIPEGLVINHKNGNKQDNRIDNLEAVTNRENVVHCWKTLGRISTLAGEGSHKAKITEAQAEDIIAKCKEGYSNKTLGEMYNLHPNYISLIRHNKRWKHLKR